MHVVLSRCAHVLFRMDVAQACTVSIVHAHHTFIAKIIDARAIVREHVCTAIIVHASTLVPETILWPRKIIFVKIDDAASAG